MTETQQGSLTSVLSQKKMFTIHYNDGEKYLDEFFNVWAEIQKLKFKGVNPLIGNELEKLKIQVTFKSHDEIRAIFAEIMMNNRITQGGWSLATVPPESGFFLNSEENIKEAVFPGLYFKTCKARGEFYGKILYWGNETSQHKRKYFGIFTPDHKIYKNNFEKSLTVILGRLKQEKEETQLQTSA